MTFEFILSTVIWYDLLNAVNKVSKTLQIEHIFIDFVLKNYVALKVFLTGYRENGCEMQKKKLKYKVNTLKYVNNWKEFQFKKKYI